MRAVSGKKTLAAVLALFCCAALSGCAETAVTKVVYAMDTVMLLTARGGGAEAAADRIEREILRLDELLSVTDGDSEVSKINAAAGEFVAVSEETADLFARAREIGDLTEGAFDITVHPVVEAWGFFSEQYRKPEDSEIKTLLRSVSYSRIEVAGDLVKLGAGQSADLGGIAKGYLVDRAAEILGEEGVKNAILQLGGSVYAIGNRPDGAPWRIGLQDPGDLSREFGELNQAGAAVVTSGSYQRFFSLDGENYHHIINPGTGAPADSGLLAVTVISADGTLADGLSTAMFVMGAERAAEFWRADRGFEMVLVNDEGEVQITEGLLPSYTNRGQYDVTVIR